MMKRQRRELYQVTPATTMAADPYPDHPEPTPAQCRSVRDALLRLHGFPKEFAAYRRKRRRRNIVIAQHQHLDVVLPQKEIENENENGKPASSSTTSQVEEAEVNKVDGVAAGESESDNEEEGESTVLDGLVSTLLSQNTTDANSGRAFRSLKSAFPTWQQVLDAEPKRLEDAIRCGGLASTKAARIRNILEGVRDRQGGEFCLEYLRRLPPDEVKAELSRFKGIGPKTIACVLMFHLQKDDFPVDTHVFRITKALGWIPTKADREKAYLHLNKRIPDELKFDLNCLFVTHGKICERCVAKRGGNHKARDPAQFSCPLECLTVVQPDRQ